MTHLFHSDLRGIDEQDLMTNTNEIHKMHPSQSIHPQVWESLSFQRYSIAYRVLLGMLWLSPMTGVTEVSKETIHDRYSCFWKPYASKLAQETQANASMAVYVAIYSLSALTWIILVLSVICGCIIGWPFVWIWSRVSWKDARFPYAHFLGDLALGDAFYLSFYSIRFWNFEFEIVCFFSVSIKYSIFILCRFIQQANRVCKPFNLCFDESKASLSFSRKISKLYTDGFYAYKRDLIEKAVKSDW